MSKDKDSTTLQEYFISGIVILFFGLLYLFLSNDFNFGSSKGNLLPTLAVAQTATPNSLADRLADNDSDKPATEDETTRKTTDSASKEDADTAPKDSAQANAVPSDNAKGDATPQQVAAMDASTDKETQESQQLASADTTPTSPQTEGSEPQVEQEQAPTEDNTSSDDEAKTEEAGASQDSGELIYKLPDGRPVEIAKDGFENSFKQAIENGDIDKPIIFDRVYFDSGSSQLRKQSDYQIQATAALLNTHKDINIAIRGHSDNKGSPKNNSILSLLRGGSMKKALADLGIDPSRIHIEGLGDQEPIASNKTKRGRRNNRRIDLVIKK